ncbi:cytochrome P450 [Hymenopellis radicata]|nr:cytochrome P450 [Hymenopellis radicata]
MAKIRSWCGAGGGPAVVSLPQTSSYRLRYLSFPPRLADCLVVVIPFSQYFNVKLPNIARCWFIPRQSFCTICLRARKTLLSTSDSLTLRFEGIHGLTKRAQLSLMPMFVAIFTMGTIPKGSTISANVWAIMHDEKMFPAPDVFDPERFLGENPQPDPTTLGAWGFGRRICSGRYLAMDAVYITIASLLWAFTFGKARDKDGQDITPDDQAYTEAFII